VLSEQYKKPKWLIAKPGPYSSSGRRFYITISTMVLDDRLTKLVDNLNMEFFFQSRFVVEEGQRQPRKLKMRLKHHHKRWRWWWNKPTLIGWRVERADWLMRKKWRQRNVEMENSWRWTYFLLFCISTALLSSLLSYQPINSSTIQRQFVSTSRFYINTTDSY